MKQWVAPVVAGGVVIGGLLAWQWDAIAGMFKSKPVTTKTNNTQQQSVDKTPTNTSPGVTKDVSPGTTNKSGGTTKDSVNAQANLAKRKLAEEHAKQLEAEAANYLEQAGQASDNGDDAAAENYKQQSDYLYQEAKNIRLEAGLPVVSTSGIGSKHLLTIGSVKVGFAPRNSVLATAAKKA